MESGTEQIKISRYLWGKVDAEKCLSAETAGAGRERRPFSGRHRPNREGDPCD